MAIRKTLALRGCPAGAPPARTVNCTQSTPRRPKDAGEWAQFKEEPIPMPLPFTAFVPPLSAGALRHPHAATKVFA